MRTTIENTKRLDYDLSLKGVVVIESKKHDTSLRHTVFYDIPEEHEMSFVGYSNEHKSTFVESLFRDL